MHTIARHFWFFTTATSFVQMLINVHIAVQSAVCIAILMAGAVWIVCMSTCCKCKSITQQHVICTEASWQRRKACPLSCPQHPYLSPASSLMGVTCSDVIAWCAKGDFASIQLITTCDCHVQSSLVHRQVCTRMTRITWVIIIPVEKCWVALFLELCF